MNIAGLIPSASFATTAGVWGLVAAILIAAIRIAPSLRKIAADADTAKDGMQAHRIKELEDRLDKTIESCAQNDRVLNARVMVVAQSTLELASEVQNFRPDSPALARMRDAFRVAFPIDVPPNASLNILAAELARKAAE